MRRLLLIALACLLAAPAGAASDFQLWTAAGLEARLAKRWRLELDQHLRFDQDASAVASVMPELAVTFRPLKYLRLGLGYRFVAEPIESQEDTYTETWHRLFADVRLRFKLAPVTLRYRLRFEEEFGWPWTKEEELTLKHTVRNLLGVEAEVTPWLTPFLSGELFVRIDDPDGALHKWRLTAGLDFTLEGHTLSLFYRLEDRLDDPAEPSAHILGTGYHYAF
jgi:hypothetical protein